VDAEEGIGWAGTHQARDSKNQSHNDRPVFENVILEPGKSAEDSNTDQPHSEHDTNGAIRFPDIDDHRLYTFVILFQAMRNLASP
jgi:hypothetical protein